MRERYSLLQARRPGGVLQEYDVRRGTVCRWKQVKVRGRSGINLVSEDDRTYGGVRLQSIPYLHLEFGIGDNGGRTGNLNQGLQVSAVTFRRELLSQERHDGRDTTVQHRAPKRVNQFLAMLKDEHHYFTWLQALTNVRLGKAVGTFQQRFVGQTVVILPGMLQNYGCALGDLIVRGLQIGRQCSIGFRHYWRD